MFAALLNLVSTWGKHFGRVPEFCRYVQGSILAVVLNHTGTCGQACLSSLTSPELEGKHVGQGVPEGLLNSLIDRFIEGF